MERWGREQTRSTTVNARASAHACLRETGFVRTDPFGGASSTYVGESTAAGREGERSSDRLIKNVNFQRKKVTLGHLLRLLSPCSLGTLRYDRGVSGSTHDLREQCGRTRLARDGTGTSPVSSALTRALGCKGSPVWGAASSGAYYADIAAIGH